MDKVFEFFDSKLIADLKEGKAPEVPVAFSGKALVDLSAALFFTALAILLASHLLKKL
ncbi:hypothetical protein GCM10023185_13140 [Hymenobacter saemangeumensis]|uniref:Uncharacterized protein n=1 Tax=Hymenobacter saemangeumensis TaxID=1084522 RepID=A0ABP8I7F6_9BACT